jgi:hypothetical protein
MIKDRSGILYRVNRTENIPSAIRPFSVPGMYRDEWGESDEQEGLKKV